MSIYKFKHNDIVYNRIKTYPKFRFFIYDEQIYINDESNISGSFVSSSRNTSTGQISLYEINVDRAVANTGRKIMYEDVKDTGLIYPFITKDGTLSSFKTVSAGSFATFGYGTVMSSSYPLTASLRRKFYQQGAARKHITALRNTLDYYTHKSNHYTYNSSLGDKSNQDLNLISIPSIAFGSSIKKGSVSLKYYLSGTLLAELVDRDRNGELIQVSGSTYAQSQGQNKVAGVVLYNEGFIILTGSWALEQTVKRDYINDPSDLQTSAWKYWGTTMPGDGYTTTSGSMEYLSYQIDYRGTNYVPVMTMLAHAPKGELNYSNNPTFVRSGQRRKLTPVTGSRIYREIDTIEAKNTMTSSYADPTGSYQKQTFITKIGLYDDDNNLIAIATLANPVKKLEDLDYTFKLKLDF
jgi:hypothetical protein